MQRDAGSDLINWLFKAYRASRGQSAGQLPPPGSGGYAREPFLDSHPWQMVEPSPDLPQPLPFYADQARTLLKIPAQELESSTRSRPQKEKAVQPPIFFPFD
jgi:hypothetical protein